LKRRFLYKSAALLLTGLSFVALGNSHPVTSAASHPDISFATQEPDTSKKEGKLIFPLKETSGNPLLEKEEGGVIDPGMPDNVEYQTEYDAKTNQVTLYRRVGNMNIRLPYTMSLEDYMNVDTRNSIINYWHQRQQMESGQMTEASFFNQKFKMGGDAFKGLFGGNLVDIKMQGVAELKVGVMRTKIDNPTLQERLRKTTTFDFEQNIQMNVTGNIGDKMKLGINYNTQALFDFENEIKLEYTGKEDEIIKKIEAGNVSMPLPGTLISGSQSLFGVKTEMQFGKLSVTSIFSQQKGQTKTMNIEGGASKQEFEVPIDEYDKNRHFFLSNTFRDQYEQALANLPIVTSPYVVTKIEVWVTNKSGNYNDSRNVVSFLDLGENSSHIYGSSKWSDNDASDNSPDNDANTLYAQLSSTYSAIRDINQVSSTFANVMTNAIEYEKIENARLLSSSEYTLNSTLGYISLNTVLQADEVVAVAYQYTYRGKVHQVGELTTSETSGDNTLWLKLLKSTNQTPSVKPAWNLMMKNIYSLGAYQVNKDDFKLDIVYVNDSTGTELTYFPEGEAAPNGINRELMLRVMNLDALNNNLDASPDGAFDYIEGVTINSSNGRVIFPVLEPFGSHLESKLNNQSTLVNKYCYKELYTTTQTDASQYAEKNKFLLKGSYKSSSSSEISLNATNIPQGSVIVTAGGIKLTENIDYTVDYTLGRIKIINSGLMESGTPLQVSLESQSLYALQTKTLMGVHLDYKFNNDFNVGATLMHLRERPMTQKVSFGDEPISNTIWGLNTSYTTQSQGLTNLLDKLPGLVAKQPSKITFEGEFAQLVPGHPKIIDKEGNSYIDDFEGTKISYDLKTWTAWKFASVPQGQNSLGMFPNAGNTDLSSGYGRAKLAWYTIDPIFTRSYAETPSHIANDKEQLSNHFVREVYEKELFPDRDAAYGTPTNIPLLNFAFYPRERGPYNFDANNIDSQGFLKNPSDSWGGIMRKIETPDFEAANIEYIEFWMMDPFVYDSTANRGGDLYFNIGSISEDILKDSRKSFEQGLPGPDEENLVDETIWGKVPRKQSLVNAFSTDVATRRKQDVGLDGFSTEEEIANISDFFSNVTSIPDNVMKDPAADNFHYYRGSDFDRDKIGILDRYKNFNSPEGNSRATEDSPEKYSTAASSIPDVEDINNDNTLSETESYFQYKVELRPQNMVVGQNHITDAVIRTVDLKNGNKGTIKWYQFRIPLAEPDTTIGEISDFRSIRFMRMFMNNATDTTILRFATLDLVRGDWRTYTNTLIDPNDDESQNAVENANTQFIASAVNIEENSDRDPVSYVLPPGVDRVIDPANPQVRELNEQSLSLKAVDLGSRDSRAVYKTVNMDMRQYKKLKMDIHAEALEGHSLENGEIVAFIRLGSDFKNNYYEYEIPLKLTPHGNYKSEIDADRYIVWPDANRLELELDKLTQAKLRRNDDKRKAGSTTTLNDVYRWNDPDIPANYIKVKGNPNLSNVKTIMLGIRVRGSQSRSVEVWMNELRLSDFNEDGGWAANARMKVDLSDLGSISVAGKTSTAGFGSIDQSVGERTQEDFYQYDVATNIEAGKFLGPKSRLSVPVYFGVSKAVTNPKYYALDPDIPLEVALKNAESKSARDSVKNLSQAVVDRKSINFTNVRLAPKETAKPSFFSPSNLSATYSYNENSKRNINTLYDTQKSHHGMLAYTYLGRPKSIEPLKDIKLLKSNYMSLLRDFNFYLTPSQISYRWEIVRDYSETQTRNVSQPTVNIPVAVSKDFNWNRYFELNYPLTKSLRLDFKSATNARIDEPEGQVNRRLNPDVYQEWKDSVMHNILSFGRVTNYTHNTNLTYNVPINKFPMLDWTSSTLHYKSMYAWITGPLQMEELGNTIKNTNNIQISGQLNMMTLYNKVSYFKDLDRKYGSRRQQQKQSAKRTERFNKDNVALEAGKPFTVNHKLKTQTITVKVFDKNGRPVQGETKIINDNKALFTPTANAENARLMVTGTVEDKNTPFTIVRDYTTLALLGVKNVSVQYNQTNGTILPGFTPDARFMGMSAGRPGVPFIFGFQDDNFAQKAFNKGWLTNDSSLNSPILYTNTEDLNIKTTIEPIKGLKLDLIGLRRLQKNTSLYYLPGAADPFSDPITTGNFSISINTIKTAFWKVDQKGAYYSKAYNNFKDIRNGSDYQDDIIKSFLAAYSGKTSMPGNASVMPSISNIQPNWRLSYDGLARIKFLKKFIKTFDISHAYNSTYQIGSFSTNLIEDGNTSNLPKYQINSVTINEQFNPLIQFNIGWMNSLTTRAEIKKSRILNLNLTNSQLIESTTKEWVIGLGYRIDKLNINIGNKAFSSDVNLRADFSIRDNLSIIRKFDENVDQLTAGQKVISAKFTADYALSDAFTMQLYYDTNVNNPYIQLSYPTSTSNFGVSFRFTLAQ
jgi:cell surface protein SprA